MTDYTRNPFFNSPYLEQTGNNLIKAFNDDGKGEENRARVGLLNAQTAKTTGENAGREATASAIQGQDFSGPIANQFWSGLAASGIRSGSDPAHVAHAIQFLRSNSKASDADIAAAVVGNKGGLGVNDGVSLGDRNAISQKTEDAAMGRTKYSADSSAGAHIAGIRISNQFQEDHPTKDRVEGKYLQSNPDQIPGAVFQPHNIPAGGAAQFAPGDPRATGPKVEGPPTERFVKVFDDKSPTGASYQKPEAGMPVPAPTEKPIKISPSDAADLQYNVLKAIPGAWDDTTKGPNSAFVKQFGDKFEPAMIAAGDVYQKTKDAALAQKALREGLGIAAGSSFEPPGIIGRTFGSGMGTVVPPVAMPAGPPAGTAQAAPTIATQFGAASAPAAAAPPALAPLPADKGQLNVGQPYQTAKGPGVWNGKNFDPYQPQNANDGAK